MKRISKPVVFSEQALIKQGPVDPVSSANVGNSAPQPQSRNPSMSVTTKRPRAIVGGIEIFGPVGGDPPGGARRCQGATCSVFPFTQDRGRIYWCPQPRGVWIYPNAGSDMYADLECPLCHRMVSYRGEWTGWSEEYARNKKELGEELPPCPPN